MSEYLNVVRAKAGFHPTTKVVGFPARQIRNREGGEKE